LEQREQHLTHKQRKIEKLWKRLKETSAMIRRDRAAHRILTEQHHVENAQLEEFARQARAEFALAQEALAEARAAREREEAEWTARREREQAEWSAQRQQAEAEWAGKQAQLEQDARALKEAHAALGQRQAEVEAADARLRQEREQHEQELARGRH